MTLNKPAPLTTGPLSWLPLAMIPERIQSGEMSGAASLVGLLHVLAFPQS